MVKIVLECIVDNYGMIDGILAKNFKCRTQGTGPGRLHDRHPDSPTELGNLFLEVTGQPVTHQPAPVPHVRQSYIS